MVKKPNTKNSSSHIIRIAALSAAIALAHLRFVSDDKLIAGIIFFALAFLIDSICAIVISSGDAKVELWDEQKKVERDIAKYIHSLDKSELSMIEEIIEHHNKPRICANFAAHEDCNGDTFVAIRCNYTDGDDCSLSVKIADDFYPAFKKLYKKTHRDLRNLCENGEIIV